MYSSKYGWGLYTEHYILGGGGVHYSVYDWACNAGIIYTVKYPAVIISVWQCVLNTYEAESIITVMLPQGWRWAV